MKKGLDCRLVFLVVVLGLRESRGDEIMLTTAKVRDMTSLKPTTIYRRINVPRDPRVSDRAPLDLFRLNTQDLRRKGHADIWDWDTWCQLQQKTGNGTKSINRYYYDAQIDQCIEFEYTWSGGNKNNFKTLGDCERYCKGAAFTSIKEITRSTACSLQPNAGQCLAMFYSFYYDVNERRCSNFIYGGCGGNANRFSSVSQCMSRCSPDHDLLADPY